GLTWVPPIDPPVVPDQDDPEGLSVAAGFGTTAEDEPFDADHETGAMAMDEELNARVHEALVADSRTSRFAERVVIESIGSVVILRGSMVDLDDADLAGEVASEVTGVSRVEDETSVEGL